MSHYQPYMVYKDSGVPWLGEVPEDWKHCSLKWISRRYAGGTPDKTVEAYWDDGTIPWLASGEVNQRLIITPSTFITEDAYKNSSAKWIPSGALVMALAGQGRTRGTVAQLSIDSTCNQSMAAIVANRIYPRFLYWWLDSNYSNLRGLSGDDVRDGLNLEVLGNIPCPLPSDYEQRTIVAHLDSETARIDGLVAKKTRFIELLREKRQALITHAVTKGLDPNVKMKDSGVEWLGEVPEHWDTIPLNLVVSTRKGVAFKPDDFRDYGVKVVKASNIKNHTIQTPDIFLPIEFVELYPKALLKAGDIILSTVGSAPEVINSAVGQIGKLPAHLDGCLLNQNTVVFTPDSKKLLNDFLFQGLKTRGYREHLDLFAHGTANQASLNVQDMLSIRIPLPEIEQQKQIMAYLDLESTRIDTLITKTERSIELLKERRSALITAAVTGQIDLRETV